MSERAKDNGYIDDWTVTAGNGTFLVSYFICFGKKKSNRKNAHVMTFLLLFTFFFFLRNFLFITIKILESLSKFPFHLLIFVCPFYCPSTSTASLFSTLLAQLLFVKNQLISACIIKLFFFLFFVRRIIWKKKKTSVFWKVTNFSFKSFFIFYFYFIESLNLCCPFLMIVFFIY